MTTPVNGPADVAVGDAVRDHGARCDSPPLIVAKVGAESMVVVGPDGKRSTRKYTAIEFTAGRHSWSKRIKESRPQFERLSAHERWRAARPVTPDVERASLVVRYSEPHRSGAIGRNEEAMAALNAALRDRPDDVIAQLRLLSEWLKAEPSKDAP